MPEARKTKPRWIWQRLRQTSGSQRLLLGEAVLCLALARVALLLPFRVLTKLLRFRKPPPDWAGLPPLSPDQMKQAVAVGWAVTRAARHVPFRAACLPQAIAAKAMLRRRRLPGVMHLGVQKESGKLLEAHAWLESGDIELTGFPLGSAIVEVMRLC